MLLKPPCLEIDESAPFALDKLGREESAKRLTHIIQRAKPPFVLALDAKYGNGKTTFIRMWRAHLKTIGICSLYFNAWEADFSSDPLIAFIGEMDEEINRITDGTNAQETLRDSWTKAKDLGAYLARKVVPVGMKIATAGVLDWEKFTEESLAKLAENITREQIENYQATKSKIVEFKARLGECIKNLGAGQVQPALPLVFFVDELDRCRPPYAIELLERIKHLFGIEEIVFVLAVDKAQLSSAIRAIYGEGIDVDGYLRRFIDLEYPLATQDPATFISSLVARHALVDLLKKAGKQDASRIVEIGVEIFRGLASTFELSLRVQEQCVACLAVILLTADAQSMHFPLLAGLLVLKSANEQLYNDFCSHKTSVTDVLSYIKATRKGKAFMEEATLFEAFLLKSRANAFDAREIIAGYQARSKTAQEEPAPTAEGLRAIYIWQQLSYLPTHDMIKDAAQSIAFADQFRGDQSAL